ncbi:MAG: hypothetical protein WC579_01670, partial [Candidatus Paceibacterota bacterium]
MNSPYFTIEQFQTRFPDAFDYPSLFRQVSTITLSGTSGTATIICVGLEKTVTFNTTLAKTAENFVTANASDFNELDIILTSNANNLIFTARTKDDFTAPTIENLTGDLNGTVKSIDTYYSEIVQQYINEASRYAEGRLGYMPSKSNVTYTFDYDEPFVLAVMRKTYAYIVAENNPSSELGKELSERADDIFDMYITGDLKFSYTGQMEFRLVENVDASSTGTIRISGKYSGLSRVVRIEIMKGGAVGTATWKYRINDNESFGDEIKTSRYEYFLV